MSTRSRSHSVDVGPLLEFSALVNSSLSTASILDAVLFSLMGKFLLTRSLVLLPVDRHLFRIANGKGIPSSLLSLQVRFTKRPKKSVLLAPDTASYPPELYHNGIRRLLPLVIILFRPRPTSTTPRFRTIRSGQTSGCLTPSPTCRIITGWWSGRG